MTPMLDTRPSAAPASEGYKVHLSETCDDTTATDLPHLITNVATTDATLTDVEMLEHIHTGLEHRNLLPDEHIVDAGYTSAELMVSTRRDFRITLLGPLRLDNSPQARTRSGFDRTAFTIDWDNHRVTCPQGVTNTIWSTCTERGRESIVVRFPAPTCQTCPVRTQCTSSTRTGRQLMLRPREIHEMVEQARGAQTTEECKTALRDPGWCRSHDPSSDRHHRHSPQPLPRPAQNAPRARHHGYRDQPDPPGCLVDQNSTWPNTDQSPHHTRRLARGVTGTIKN
jgi:Transposase DDE domain